MRNPTYSDTNQRAENREIKKLYGVSMTKILIIVSVYILFETSVAFGGNWAVGYIDSGEKFYENLNDKDYLFTLAGMRCGVTSSQLSKLYNEIFEIREIYCWTDKTTRVGTELSANVRSSEAEARSLYIYKKGQQYTAILYYFPKGGK